jgi:hypothetical protein
MGIPEIEAKRFETKVKSGSVLISVHTEDLKQVDIAKEIFARNGAEDISGGDAMSARAA